MASDTMRPTLEEMWSALDRVTERHVMSRLRAELVKPESYADCIALERLRDLLARIIPHKQKFAKAIKKWEEIDG